MLILRESERVVLQLLARGMTPKEIASDRGVACDTIHHQMKDAKERNQLRTREQMIALFVEEMVMGSGVRHRTESVAVAGAGYSGRGLRAG